MNLMWELLTLGIVATCFWVVSDSLDIIPSVTNEGAPMTLVEMRRYVNATLMVGLLLWPLLWSFGVTTKSVLAIDRMVQKPRLCIGFFWPLIMILIDLQYTLRKRTDGNHFESIHRIGYLQGDANTIITAAFALGTLLSNLKKEGKVTEGSQIVMYSLLLCVAFVIPTSEAPVMSKTSLIIRSAQKVCLNYAIGFLIAGLACDLV